MVPFKNHVFDVKSSNSLLIPKSQRFSPMSVSNRSVSGTPGGPVVQHPPSSAEEAGLIPGRGAGSHMPWGN